METSVLILMRIVSRLTPQIRKKKKAISASGLRMYRVQEMAKHIQLKLPSFRVTVRPTSGPVQKKIIHRSATSQVSQKLDSIEPSSPKPLLSLPTPIHPVLSSATGVGLEGTLPKRHYADNASYSE